MRALGTKHGVHHLGPHQMIKVRMSNPVHDDIKQDIVRRVALAGPIHDGKMNYRDKFKVFRIVAEQMNEELSSQFTAEQIKVIAYKLNRGSVKNTLWDLPPSALDDDCAAMYGDREELSAKLLYSCSTSLVIVSIQIALALTYTSWRSISTVRPKEIHHLHAHTQRNFKLRNISPPRHVKDGKSLLEYAKSELNESSVH